MTSLPRVARELLGSINVCVLGIVVVALFGVSGARAYVPFSFSPAYWDFREVKVGAARKRIIRVISGGDTRLRGFESSSKEFLVKNVNCPLKGDFAFQSECKILVTFSPRKSSQGYPVQGEVRVEYVDASGPGVEKMIVIGRTPRNAK